MLTRVKKYFRCFIYYFKYVVGGEKQYIMQWQKAYTERVHSRTLKNSSLIATTECLRANKTKLSKEPLINL